MKAMIFAAGLGTRLQPITNDKPKALVEVNNKTLLEIVIQRLQKFGFTEIIVNVHHFADQIIEYLKANDNFGMQIAISDESDKLLDTGGGLKKAKSFFDDQPFLVHNVDIISDINLADLYKFHFNSKALSTVAVRNRVSSRYLLFNDNNLLSGWKNVKTGETIITREPEDELKPLAFSGIHVIDPEIFVLMPDEEVFSIIDLYLTISRKEKILAYRDDNSFWQDVGKIEDLNKIGKN